MRKGSQMKNIYNYTLGEIEIIIEKEGINIEVGNSLDRIYKFLRERENRLSNFVVSVEKEKIAQAKKQIERKPKEQIYFSLN